MKETSMEGGNSKLLGFDESGSHADANSKNALISDDRASVGIQLDQQGDQQLTGTTDNSNNNDCDPIQWHEFLCESEIVRKQNITIRLQYNQLYMNSLQQLLKESQNETETSYRLIIGLSHAQEQFLKSLEGGTSTTGTRIITKPKSTSMTKRNISTSNKQGKYTTKRIGNSSNYNIKDGSVLPIKSISVLINSNGEGDGDDTTDYDDPDDLHQQQPDETQGGHDNETEYDTDDDGNNNDNHDILYILQQQHYDMYQRIQKTTPHQAYVIKKVYSLIERSTKYSIKLNTRTKEILDHLQQIEYNVQRAWDTYNHTASVLFLTNEGDNANTNTHTHTHTHTNNSIYTMGNVWLAELKYRSAVSYQIDEWIKNGSVLYFNFSMIKDFERIRRLQLRKYLHISLKKQQLLFTSTIQNNQDNTRMKQRQRQQQQQQQQQQQNTINKSIDTIISNTSHSEPPHLDDLDVDDDDDDENDDVINTIEWMEEIDKELEGQMKVLMKQKLSGHNIDEDNVNINRSNSLSFLPLLSTTSTLYKKRVELQQQWIIQQRKEKQQLQFNLQTQNKQHATRNVRSSKHETTDDDDDDNDNDDCAYYGDDKYHDDENDEEMNEFSENSSSTVPVTNTISGGKKKDKQKSVTNVQTIEDNIHYIGNKSGSVSFWNLIGYNTYKMNINNNNNNTLNPEYVVDLSDATICDKKVAESTVVQQQIMSSTGTNEIQNIDKLLYSGMLLESRYVQFAAIVEMVVEENDGTVIYTTDDNIVYKAKPGQKGEVVKTMPEDEPAKLCLAVITTDEMLHLFDLPDSHKNDHTTSGNNISNTITTRSSKNNPATAEEIFGTDTVEAQSPYLPMNKNDNNGKNDSAMHLSLSQSSLSANSIKSPVSPLRRPMHLGCTPEDGLTLILMHKQIQFKKLLDEEFKESNEGKQNDTTTSTVTTTPTTSSSTHRMSVNPLRRKQLTDSNTNAKDTIHDGKSDSNTTSTNSASSIYDFGLVPFLTMLLTQYTVRMTRRGDIGLKITRNTSSNTIGSNTAAFSSSTVHADSTHGKDQNKNDSTSTRGTEHKNSNNFTKNTVKSTTTRMQYKHKKEKQLKVRLKLGSRDDQMAFVTAARGQLTRMEV